MPNKTLYIKDGSTWNRAMAVARLRGTSLSEVIYQFLVRYIEDDHIEGYYGE